MWSRKCQHSPTAASAHLCCLQPIPPYSPACICLLLSLTDPLTRCMGLHSATGGCVGLHRGAQSCTELRGAAWGCMGLHRAACGCRELHGVAWGCTELHGATRSCMGLHGAAWSCTVCGAEGGDVQRGPRLAQLAGLALLPQLPTHMRKRQGMLRGTLRRLWSIHLTDGLLRSTETSQPGGATHSHRSPGSCLGSEEWLGVAKGVPALHSGQNRIPTSLCCSAAAPALLSPGELAEGMPSSFHLHPLRLFQTRLPGQ